MHFTTTDSQKDESKLSDSECTYSTKCFRVIWVKKNMYKATLGAVNVECFFGRKATAVQLC